MGCLHEELGEMAGAEECFRAAVRLQPLLPGPHARLATLLRGKLPDADLAALEARLAEPGLGQEGRSNLLFGLAHVLDARGEYRRAADCLRQANALALEQATQRHRAYEPQEHDRFVDSLLAGCDAAFFRRPSTTSIMRKRWPTWTPLPGGSSRHVALSGSRPAWNFTARHAPSAPPAPRKSGNRFTIGRSDAGRTLKRLWPSCLRASFDRPPKTQGGRSKVLTAAAKTARS
ncbi:MAG TPA: hypothetical protein PK867_00785, partial [Pirellulales bacterium]|nr:hypothetical protein [Pirellulales bacterium]